MNKSANVVWQTGGLTREDRERQNAQTACVVWFTGLPCSGKSTVARAVERQLHAAGRRVYVLDGDNVRHGLCGDLGFPSLTATRTSAAWPKWPHCCAMVV